MRPNFVRFSPRARRLLALGPVLAALSITGLAGCSSWMDGESDTSRPVGATLAGGPSRPSQISQAAVQLGERAQVGQDGLVLADEPNAALIGRAIIEQGGSAADAAAAVYFGLSVTHPAAAGLGGGGVCLAHSAATRSTESIDFLPRRPREGGRVAIPGNVRGMALLHARHGRLGWGQIIAPAENLAGVGFPVSRALARSIADNQAVVAGDPLLAQTFLGPDGLPVKELQRVSRPEVAAALGLIRGAGPLGFYKGTAAEALVAASRNAGGALSLDDLRDYRPGFSPAADVSVGANRLLLPSARLGAGTYMQAMWTALGKAGTAADASILKALAGQELAALGVSGPLPHDFGSTGFLVATADGDAVACAVTMNGAFGTGYTARGAGVLFANSPEVKGAGLAPAFLAPALIANANNGNFYAGAVAAGGPASAPAVLELLRRTQIEGRDPLADTVATLSPGSTSLMNAIVCPNGLSGGCQMAVDPNGNGLGLQAIGGGE